MKPPECPQPPDTRGHDGDRRRTHYVADRQSRHPETLCGWPLSDIKSPVIDPPESPEGMEPHHCRVCTSALRTRWNQK